MMQDVTNERWINAVINNSMVGCRYVHMDDPDVIDQVVDISSGEHAIHVAVRNRNLELVEYLGENNVDINCQSRIEKETALHIAARQADTTMIKVLLSLGADISVKNSKGKIPRDVCTNKTMRREFTAARADKLRRQKKSGQSVIHHHPNHKHGNLKPQSSTNDVYIGGESVEKVGLRKLREINAGTDTETEAAKRSRAKKEEIDKRGDKFLTPFGRKVGCEVDEMALFLERLDKSARRELWSKIMHQDKQTDKQIDIKKIVNVLAYSVARKKQQQKSQGKSVKSMQKPDFRQIERLVSILRRQFPRDLQSKKKTLTREDFVNKLHLWLYEIHDSEDWQRPLV